MKLGILILTGGKSSRMKGHDKSQLTLNGHSFFDILTKEFEKEETKFISDNQNLLHYKDGYLTIKDEYHEIGPISGIVSTFHQSNVDALYVIGCDMPFITKDVLYSLKERLENYEGVFIFDEKYVYPLSGIYTRNMLPILEKHIETQRYSLKSCIQESNVLKLSLEKLNIDKDILRNINTIEDYKMITK